MLSLFRRWAIPQNIFSKQLYQSPINHHLLTNALLLMEQRMAPIHTQQTQIPFVMQILMPRFLAPENQVMRIQAPIRSPTMLAKQIPMLLDHVHPHRPCVALKLTVSPLSTLYRLGGLPFPYTRLVQPTVVSLGLDFDPAARLFALRPHSCPLCIPQSLQRSI